MNKFVWDGERVKRIVMREETKHTPKDIIDSLAQVRAQINQMQQQIEQSEAQIKRLKADLESAKQFEEQLKPFEARCNELQLEKLKHLVNKITGECKELAEKKAKEIIAKDPNALNSVQKENLPYLNFQRELATHKKVAEKISRQIITKYLYDEPIFENPFKD